MNFAQTKNWYISAGEVYKVVDSNGDIIWSKGALPTNYVKNIVDNADKTTPSGIGEIIVKNISGETGTLTLKLTNENIYDDYPDDRPAISVKDNSGNSIPCTFSPTNKTVTITINSNECVGFSTSVTTGHMTNYVGKKPICKLSCDKPYIIIGNTSLVSNHRLPFTPSGDPNCWSAGDLTVSLNISSMISDESSNTYYQSLFDTCQNLIYPADLKVIDAVCYSYMYDRTYRNCTNLTRVMTTPIKVPSTIYNLYMCRETYLGCEHIVNADNAIVFGIAGYQNRYSENTVSGTNIAQILYSSCSKMFSSCTRLKYARFSLPWAQAYSEYGTIYRQTSNGYNYMFENCRSLIEPPKLEKVYDCSGSNPGAGGTLISSWYSGFAFGAYKGIFYQCYNLQKIVLVVKATDPIRWIVPADEYTDRGNSSGSDWEIASDGTSTKDWLTVGANPFYGLDPDAIADNQTGKVFYYAGSNYYPKDFGPAQNGYLPSGWTLELRQ